MRTLRTSQNQKVRQTLTSHPTPESRLNSYDNAPSFFQTLNPEHQAPKSPSAYTKPATVSRKPRNLNPNPTESFTEPHRFPVFINSGPPKLGVAHIRFKLVSDLFWEPLKERLYLLCFCGHPLVKKQPYTELTSTVLP